MADGLFGLCGSERLERAISNDCVVTNAEARFNKIHIRKVYACLAVTCHLNELFQTIAVLSALV